MTKPLTIAGQYNQANHINPPNPNNIASIYTFDHRKTDGDIEVCVYISEIMPPRIADSYRNFTDYQEVASFIAALKKKLKWPIIIMNHEKDLMKFAS